jgi:hypothetical protein
MIRPMEITAQEAMDLAKKVNDACPGIEEGLGIPTGNLITEVIGQVLGALGDLEQATKGGTEYGPGVAVSRMLLGALDHLADTLPPDRKEVQFHRAGRAIGRFMAAKFAEVIRNRLPSDA